MMVGTSNPNTERWIRLNEMLSTHINNGHKLSIDDVVTMQLDKVDVLARDAVPFF